MTFRQPGFILTALRITAVNDYGKLVEEFEIQVIDASGFDCKPADVLALNQVSFERFCELSAALDYWKKIKAIIARGEYGYCANPIDTNEDFEDLEIYKMDSIGEHIVDEGLTGDIRSPK